VPNRYSVSEENLRRVDAIEIKFGQSVKPGMGGHLPGKKVSPEIASVRGFPEGSDIISPSHFPDILDREDLLRTVEWLRETSGGRPVGVKIAAGDIEADLEIALFARPDFITVDGRAGATGAAPKFVKMAAAVPTLFALHRARKFLDEQRAERVSLLITGGLRISPDFAKALALGADAVAIGTAALMAIGCQQYRQCNTGRCPMGIATHDPELRARIDVEVSAQRLANFLHVSTEELKDFARLTGNDDVHGLSVSDLCTTCVRPTRRYRATRPSSTSRLGRPVGPGLGRASDPIAGKLAVCRRIGAGWCVRRAGTLSAHDQRLAMCPGNLGSVRLVFPRAG